MKKIYEKPKLEIKSFNAEDIMSLSVVRGSQTTFDSVEYSALTF